MNWKHGYYADAGYTYGYYPETMPARLRWASLIQGHRAPAAGFRYLDAGCGQGLNLILAAASHPESDFVGIDFLPEHIAHARQLVERAGLANITFLEGDFIALSEDAAALGEFDYVVCHGITTWIAPPVKERLFHLIGQVLKPGGLFYNSYNTFPGWLGSVPFQHLVLLHQRQQRGPLALQTAQATLNTLKNTAPALFNALPGLLTRLQSMAHQDSAYLVQEYNNQFWQPVFVTQMMDALAAVKLSYLGTATLPESDDGVLPESVRQLLAEQPTLSLREQLRDYAFNQTFRRDLYIKGAAAPWRVEQDRLVRALRAVANPLVARPAAGTPYRIQGGSIGFDGDATLYGGLLDRIASQPEGVKLGELIAPSADASVRRRLVQSASMLLHGGWLLPLLPDAAPSQTKYRHAVNLALAQAACDGAPYRYLTLPRTGCAITCTDTDWIMLRNHFEQRPEAEWATNIQTTLQQLNRALAKDGQAVTDPAEQQQILQQAIADFTTTKLPFYRAMGAV